MARIFRRHRTLQPVAEKRFGARWARLSRLVAIDALWPEQSAVTVSVPEPRMPVPESGLWATRIVCIAANVYLSTIVETRRVTL